MILKAEEKHKEQIMLLWNKAFGDGVNDIQRYLVTLFQYILVYEEQDIVKGMLAVLPVTLDDKKGGYIYAVTTDEKFRGQGICRALVEYVKQSKNYDFLVLVPQNQGLFELYRKMDFKDASASLKKEIQVSGDAENEITIENLTSFEYEAVRNKYFYRIIKWGSEILLFAQEMYDGTFCKVIDEKNEESFAFLYKDGEKVVIKELLSKTPDKIASEIGGFFGADKVVYSYPDKSANPDYMIYKENDKGLYFGIYLD